MNRYVKFLLATAAVMLVSVLTVDATSYVMVADEDLTDGADAIVLGTVISRSVVELEGRILTEYLIETERRLKGDLPTSVRVQRPGGILPDGRAFVVFDMPELQTGQRTLAFLNARSDGSWSFEHQLMGVFSVSTVEGVTVAHRSVPGAFLNIDDPRRQHRRASLLQAHKPRDLDGFLNWVETRVHGAEAPGDYYLDLEVPRTQVETFGLFEDDSGNNFHWHPFSPGEKGKVSWVLERKKAKYKQLKQKGKKAFKIVLKAWSKVFDVSVAFGGKTKARGVAWAGNADDAHSWIFQDPGGNIDDTYMCAVGGVLAKGGFSARSPIHAATGSGGSRTYWDIFEGDVVFQDGIDCLFGTSKPANDAIVAEIGAHEMGHALGLGHSEISETLMAPFAHLDGRGANIGDDERAAARALDYSSAARSGRR